MGWDDLDEERARVLLLRRETHPETDDFMGLRNVPAVTNERIAVPESVDGGSCVTVLRA